MKIRYAIWGLVLMTAGCGTKKAETVSLPAQLHEYFTKEFPAGEPGGAVLVSINDTVIFSKGYGLADVNTKEAITPKTLFNLGSISKTFVAFAIKILEDQHKLSAEDNLDKYFPEFKNKAIARKIKIRHLLSHTSGLPDNRAIKKDSVFYLTAKDAENWYPVTQNDTLHFEPGERYEYSNPAYNGLALIIEKVSGMKWQQFVAENILKPSGMATTTITDGAHPSSGVSHGYIKRNGQWLEKDFMEEPTFCAAGNGGVWSSVEELELYEEAIHKYRFLSEESTAQARTVFQYTNWKDTVPPKVAWSWFVDETNDGLKTVGHTGDQGGFQCNYVTIPAKGIHLYILCNTPRDRERMTAAALALCMRR